MVTILFPSGRAFISTVNDARIVVRGSRLVRGVTPRLGGAQWLASYVNDETDTGFSIVATDRTTLARIVEGEERT